MRLLLLIISLFLPLSQIFADDSLSPETYLSQRQVISEQFAKRNPREWSEHATGVKTRLNTSNPEIALTFDACGGWGEGSYDYKLINVLRENEIPATLFVSGEWAKNHAEILRELSQDQLFEIENHGNHHKVCSINGRTVYGLPSSKSVSDVIDEIFFGMRGIEFQGNSIPRFYRSAGAFSDDVCPEIANALGVTMVSFSVLGDGGARYAPQQVTQTLLSAPIGSIVLLHMNHFGSGTAKGLSDALPELKRRGIRFVKLNEVGLK